MFGHSRNHPTQGNGFNSRDSEIERQDRDPGAVLAGQLYTSTYLSVVLWGWHGSAGRHGLKIPLISRTILGLKEN